MGTVTNSIGTAARDYATVALWEAALPANLVTDGNSYVGECYNDSEFAVAGNVVTLSGSTTDATHTITLKCATGQSFRDNASVQSNALRYNQTNGVGLAASTGHAVDVAEDYIYLDGLQIKQTAGFEGSAALKHSGSPAAGPFVSNCIIAITSTSAQFRTVSGNSTPASQALAATYTNCLIYNNGSTYTTSVQTLDTLQSGRNIYYCTIIANGANYNIKTLDKAYDCKFKVVGCAFFGAATGVTDGTTFSPLGIDAATGYNATDQTSTTFGGSGNQTSLTAANQFQNASTGGSADLRAKTGGAIIDTGTDLSSLMTSVDIAKTARPSGSAWDIGAWELVQAAVNTGPDRGAIVGMTHLRITNEIVCYDMEAR